MHYDRAASYIINGRRRIILALDDFENTQLRYKCAQKRYYCDAELYLSSVMLDLSFAKISLEKNFQVGEQAPLYGRSFAARTESTRVFASINVAVIEMSRM